MQALADAITDRLNALRKIEGLSAVDPMCTRIQAEADLGMDFSQGSVPLESWSVLYYRYVRVDLDMQVQDIERITGVAARQIRRRETNGCWLLAGLISRYEQETRFAHWDIWLQSKLPARQTDQLHGVGDLIETVGASIAQRPGAVTALTAPGGMGKTTIAREVAAHLLQHHVFDEFAWLTLHSPVTEAELLNQLAVQLGFLHLFDAALEERKHALRILLAQRRALIVIDNADYLTMPLVRLVNLVGGGHVLLTSRHRPDDTDISLTNYPIPPPSFGAFHAMIADHIRQLRLPRLSDDTLRDIYDAAEGNILVGKALASHLGLHAAHTVNLGTLQANDGQGLLSFLFEDTWQQLPEDAQLVALSLRLLAAEPIDEETLSKVSGLHADSVARALKALDKQLVLRVDEPGLFTLHPLFEEYLGQLAGQNTAEVEAIIERTFTRQADLSLNLLGAVPLLFEQTSALVDNHRLAVMLLEAAPYARQMGQWLVWRNVLAMAAGQVRQEDDHLHGLLLIEWGTAERWLGNMPYADDLLEAAIIQLGAVGDFLNQSRALIEHGRLHQQQGHIAQAEIHFQQALATAHRLQDVAVFRQAARSLIGIAFERDDLKQADALLKQALDTYEPDEELDSGFLSAKSTLALAQGETIQARMLQQEALLRCAEEGNVPELSWAHVRLALIYHREGAV
ncbi:MAG: AAA family ATPase [Anaerolineae bacterium]